MQRQRLRRDLTGQRFGRLMVLEPDGKRFRNGDHRGTIRLWKVRCDCGKVKVVSGPSLYKGNTKSCGCLKIEMAQKRMLEIHRLSKKAVDLIP